MKNRRYGYETMFRYLKSGLIGIDNDDINLLENYVLANGIKGKKWFDENDFNFVKKPGVGLILEENIENQNFIIELLEEEKIEKEYSKEERNLIILSKLLVSIFSSSKIGRAHV